jgi:signal peptidase I
VIIVVAAFVIAMLIQFFLVKPFVIPSASMEPTLMVGDRILVNRVEYRFREPKRGDVIVFHEPGQPTSYTPLIKRVVAIGGDTVAVHDGFLYLNGRPQPEPYIMAHPILNEFAQVTVPSGDLWVMGDNRNDSSDSRVFGPVSVKAVIGEAFLVYWPINRMRGF